MRRVVHLMPYDGIGGVERAAATAEGMCLDDLMIIRMFAFHGVTDRSTRAVTFNPFMFWTAAGRLTKLNPDLVILSLWRSLIVGFLARFRGCRTPFVLFLHNSRDAHVIDGLVTRLAARHVVAVWGDSATTLADRLPSTPLVPTRVISYLLDKPIPSAKDASKPSPKLIFWGRLAIQKNPMRMLNIFAMLHAKQPNATLTVIGPDGGMERALRDEIDRRGLQDVVTLVGPLPRSRIAQLAAGASFYLQTSKYEGMAISVVEAMQWGLVPVVTPVGEIARYTTDGRDSIWIGADTDEDKARIIARIESAIDEPEIWHGLSEAASRAFSDKPLYATDVLMAATEALDAVKRKAVAPAS